MAGKTTIWDINSMEDIEIPEVFTENAKMGIARIQFEALKVKELQRMNEKLDRLIAVMAPINVKPAKTSGGTTNG